MTGEVICVSEATEHDQTQTVSSELIIGPQGWDEMTDSEWIQFLILNSVGSVTFKYISTTKYKLLSEKVFQILFFNYFAYEGRNTK